MRIASWRHRQKKTEAYRVKKGPSVHRQDRAGAELNASCIYLAVSLMPVDADSVKLEASIIVNDSILLQKRHTTRTNGRSMTGMAASSVVRE
jgi:hypothetical protein